MNSAEHRLIGFDVLRAGAIFFVFIAHILNKQCDNTFVLIVEKAISPGVTMAILGFISGYLLIRDGEKYDWIFYLKRMSRIYSSLFVCLSVVAVFHLYLSYDVLNQHSILHYLGLSLFFNLLQVKNMSSIGSGLWFITVILILYLTLPIIKMLYEHHNRRIHIVLIIIICLFFEKIMYGAASSWNVIMAFQIGCYFKLNMDIKTFKKKRFLLVSCLLIFMDGLSKNGIISNEIRDFLLPMFSFFVVPFLYNIGCMCPKYLKKYVVLFSSISFEVYILHFYFINENLIQLFPEITSLWSHMALSLSIVLPIAYILSKVSSFINGIVIRYFKSQNSSGDIAHQSHKN